MTAEGVRVADVVRAASLHEVALAPETAGYLALAFADAMVQSPRSMDPKAAILLVDGGGVLVTSLPRCAPQDAEALLRILLKNLLLVSVGRAPALEAAASRQPAGAIREFVAELEAALVPLNREASRRALSRLAREVLRARDHVSDSDAPSPLRREPPARHISKAEHRDTRSIRAGLGLRSPEARTSEAPSSSIRPPRSADQLLQQFVSSPPTGLIGPRQELLLGSSGEVYGSRGAATGDPPRGESAGSAEQDPGPAPLPAIGAAEVRGARAGVGRSAGVGPIVEGCTVGIASEIVKASTEAITGGMASAGETEGATQSGIAAADGAPVRPGSAGSEGSIRATKSMSTSSSRRVTPDVHTEPAASVRQPSIRSRRAADGRSGGVLTVLGCVALVGFTLAIVWFSPGWRGQGTSGEHSNKASSVVRETTPARAPGGASAHGGLPAAHSGTVAPSGMAPSGSGPFAAVAASNVVPDCLATVIVDEMPPGSELLLRVGVAPSDLEATVSSRAEFVATADGYAARRSVLPPGTTWEKGRDNRPRFELAIQLEPTHEALQSWPWPDTSLPADSLRGVLHVVTNPPGAEIWSSRGVGPTIRVDRLTCGVPAELLLVGWKSGRLSRQRLRVSANQLTPEKGQRTAVAHVAGRL